MHLGIGGVAWMYFRFFQTTQDAVERRNHLHTSYLIVEKCIAKRNWRNIPTFYFGKPGVWAMAYLVYDSLLSIQYEHETIDLAM